MRRLFLLAVLVASLFVAQGIAFASEAIKISQGKHSKSL